MVGNTNIQEEEGSINNVLDFFKNLKADASEAPCERKDSIETPTIATQDVLESLKNIIPFEPLPEKTYMILDLLVNNVPNIVNDVSGLNKEIEETFVYPIKYQKMVHYKNLLSHLDIQCSLKK